MKATACVAAALLVFRVINSAGARPTDLENSKNQRRNSSRVMQHQVLDEEYVRLDLEASVCCYKNTTSARQL